MMLSLWKRGALLIVPTVVVLTVFWVTRARLEDRVPRKLGVQPDGTNLVPTNQLLSPAGFQLLFPGRPTDLALSPDGDLLAIKNIRDVVLVRIQDRADEDTLNRILWHSIKGYEAPYPVAPRRR